MNKITVAVLSMLSAFSPLAAWAWTHDDLGKQSLSIDFDEKREASGAMTFKAPADWNIQGRWFGDHPDDRFVIKMNSIDHHMFLQLSDPQVPLHYVIPSPGLPPRGQSLTYNRVKFFVAGYSTGLQFAKSYAAMMYSNPQACSQFQITDAIPDTVPTNLYIAPGVDPGNATAGLAFFTCDKPNGDRLDGVVGATTIPLRLPGGLIIWNVAWLWHYIGSEAMARPGYLIARHVTDSIRIDPQWVAAHYPPPPPPQAGPVGGGIIRNPDGTYRPDVAGANAAFDHQQQRFHTMMQGDASQQNMNNIITGTMPTTDPNIGTQYMRPYGPGDTHCANGLGGFTDSSNANCGQGYYRLQNR